VHSDFRIVASVYRSLIDILVEHGQHPADISRRIGFDITRIGTPQVTLSLDTVTALWELGHATCGASIGIEAAQRVRLVDFQDIGVFLTATRDITDLMNQLDHYSRLFSNVMELRTAEIDAGLEVSVHYHAPVPLKNERLEFLALAGPVLASQYLTSPLRLTQAALPRSRPERAERWDTAFGVPVQWGAPLTRYVISREESHRAVLTRNEQLRKDLQMLLDARLRSTEQAHPLDDVVAEMTKQLGDRAPSVESVAAALYLSPRTLQRRIAQASSTFSSLLASIREDLSKHYLRQGLSASQVAERLGYSDMPTFNRAFKRWTGETPTRFAQRDTRGPESLNR